jgi:hypothetical protein
MDKTPNSLFKTKHDIISLTESMEIQALDEDVKIEAASSSLLQRLAAKNMISTTFPAMLPLSSMSAFENLVYGDDKDADESDDEWFWLIMTG